MKERTTIGRKPHNDIQIDNLAVSGEHAVIVTIMNDCFLEDLGSTNGTLVNGAAVKKHLLQNRDVIELGKYKLVFVGQSSAPAPAPADYEKTMVWRPPAASPAVAQALGAAPAVAPLRTAPAAAPLHTAPAAVPLRTATAAAPAPASAPAKAEPAAAAMPAASRTAHPRGAIRILSGARAGKELDLSKPLTTLGKPGLQVAVLTRRPQGYFIAHVEGGRQTEVNGLPIGVAPHALKDHDSIEVAGVKMEFILRSASERSGKPVAPLLWKVGLVLLGIVVAGLLTFRMRG